jgi:cytochrome b6-f complex iron-sulfur subunit
MAEHPAERGGPPDDALERLTPAAERLNAAIDSLLAERRPAVEPGDADEAELLLLAATLKQLRPDAASPRLEYADELGAQLRAARRPRRTPLSRRRVLATGAAASAAVAAGAAGFAIARLTEPRPATPPSQAGGRDPNRDLTLVNGEWFSVARLADVPPGTVVAFNAGAVIGHLINDNGNLQALSAICTHMGCILRWQADEREFLCPCHNAIFGPDGIIRPTPEYPFRPPPLPRLQVKVENGEVLVWSTGGDEQGSGARAPDAAAPGTAPAADAG